MHAVRNINKHAQAGAYIGPHIQRTCTHRHTQTHTIMHNTHVHKQSRRTYSHSRRTYSQSRRTSSQSRRTYSHSRRTYSHSRRTYSHSRRTYSHSRRTYSHSFIRSNAIATNSRLSLHIYKLYDLIYNLIYYLNKN